VSVKSTFGSCCGESVRRPSRGTFTPHHRVHIEGEGPRTVIRESGFGDTLDYLADNSPQVWRPLRQDILIQPPAPVTSTSTRPVPPTRACAMPQAFVTNCAMNCSAET